MLHFLKQVIFSLYTTRLLLTTMLVYKGKLTVGRSFKANKSRIVVRKSSELLIGNAFKTQANTHLEVAGGSKMCIGDNVTMNYNCQVYGDVSIGNGCTLASEIYISTFDHSFKAKPYLPIKVADKLYPVPSKPIVIEEDVWIGKNVFIKPGVYIARGCIIGSNQSVIKSIVKPYTILVSSRPEVLRERLEYIAPKNLEAKPEHIPYFYRGFKISFESNFEVFIEKEAIFAMSKDNYANQLSIHLNKLPSLLRFGTSSSFVSKVEFLAENGESRIIDRKEFVTFNSKALKVPSEFVVPLFQITTNENISLIKVQRHE